MARRICTGESWVSRPLTDEEYMFECDPEFMTTFMCGYFGVPEPILKENPTAGVSGDYRGGTQVLKFRGHYYCDTGVMSYNCKYTGLIMHELAHHILWQLYGLTGHGKDFGEQLQEIIDVWR